jgi:hypothetical protein
MATIDAPPVRPRATLVRLLWLSTHEGTAVQIIGATGAAINASATRNMDQLNVLGRTVLTASSP